MPFGYHLNQDDGLVTITGNDKASLAEAIALGRKLLLDPVFDPELPHLVDLRGLEVAASTQETHELRDFVLQDYRPSVQASVAVVIDHTLDQHSVAGLYHLSCAMDQTELFDHYDHALRWLMRREFAAGAARG